MAKDMHKTADTDLLGGETHLQTSQVALETEENPLLQQARTPVGGEAPADAAQVASLEAEPGKGENTAGFLKGSA
jgi:hypothetical protein